MSTPGDLLRLDNLKRSLETPFWDGSEIKGDLLALVARLETGERYPAPWEVAEQIAAAIEPSGEVKPYSEVKNRRQALHWAASVARSLFPRPL